MAAVDEFYGRKLLRSPEKELYHLSEADLRLICELRSVMQGVQLHRRVNCIKGEMNEK